MKHEVVHRTDSKERIERKLTEVRKMVEAGGYRIIIARTEPHM
jgi:hypothetical protein